MRAITYTVCVDQIILDNSYACLLFGRLCNAAPLHRSADDTNQIPGLVRQTSHNLQMCGTSYLRQTHYPTWLTEVRCQCRMLRNNEHPEMFGQLCPGMLPVLQQDLAFGRVLLAYNAILPIYMADGFFGGDPHIMRRLLRDMAAGTHPGQQRPMLYRAGVPRKRVLRSAKDAFQTLERLCAVRVHAAEAENDRFWQTILQQMPEYWFVISTERTTALCGERVNRLYAFVQNHPDWHWLGVVPPSALMTCAQILLRADLTGSFLAQQALVFARRYIQKSHAPHNTKAYISVMRHVLLQDRIAKYLRNRWLHVLPGNMLTDLSVTKALVRADPGSISFLMVAHMHHHNSVRSGAAWNELQGVMIDAIIAHCEWCVADPDELKERQLTETFYGSWPPVRWVDGDSDEKGLYKNFCLLEPNATDITELRLSVAEELWLLESVQTLWQRVCSDDSRLELLMKRYPCARAHVQPSASLAHSKPEIDVRSYYETKLDNAETAETLECLPVRHDSEDGAYVSRDLYSHLVKYAARTHFMFLVNVNWEHWGHTYGDYATLLDLCGRGVIASPQTFIWALAADVQDNGATGAFRARVLAACASAWATATSTNGVHADDFNLRISRGVKFLLSHYGFLLSLLRDIDNTYGDHEGSVRAAVSNCGAVLCYASERLRAHFDVVALACANNGLALQFASRNMRANRRIVSIAVENNGNALWFADIALRRDDTYVRKAVLHGLLWRHDEVHYDSSPQPHIYAGVHNLAAHGQPRNAFGTAGTIIAVKINTTATQPVFRCEQSICPALWWARMLWKYYPEVIQPPQNAQWQLVDVINHHFYNNLGLAQKKYSNRGSMAHVVRASANINWQYQQWRINQDCADDYCTAIGAPENSII